MHGIMIVDDDPNDIELTIRALRKSRDTIAVTTAPRGEAALLLLGSAADLPPVILLDLKMPGMSGIDTLHRLRSDERLKRIPVVIITNSTLESDRSAALEAGADGFLHKAFDMNEFSRDLKTQLDRWLKD